MLKRLFVDWKSTHLWRRPICWLIGHAETWTHPSPRVGAALESCYRCGATWFSEKVVSWGLLPPRSPKGGSR